LLIREQVYRRADKAKRGGGGHNLLGSNIFNSLGILGLVCLIQPISISATKIAIPVIFAVIATLISSLSTKYSPRSIGAILVGAYLLYLATITVL